MFPAASKRIGSPSLSFLVFSVRVCIGQVQRAIFGSECPAKDLRETGGERGNDVKCSEECNLFFETKAARRKGGSENQVQQN